MVREFWGRKTVCLVTGAGQNIGRALAEQVASKLGPDSLLILASRGTADKLGVVRQSIYEQNPNVRIELVQWDAANPDGRKYISDLHSLLSENHQQQEIESEEMFELALIIHNAGIRGTETPLIEAIDGALVQDHFNIDLISVLVTNSAFWSVFGGRKSREKVLINITTTADLLDHSDGSGGGVNYVSKACRKLALNTLAAECPDIRVAHFAAADHQLDRPTVPETALAGVIRRASEGGDDPTKVMRKVQELYEHDKVQRPTETARALLDFLGGNELEPCMEIDARRFDNHSDHDYDQQQVVKEKF